MTDAAFYSLLADLILIIHFLIVAFIVLGLLLIIAGRLLDWGWIYNGYFRIGHLAAIVIVVLQAWMGQLCPLTTWEQALRGHAGQDMYRESFIQHWLHRLLFFDAEMWVFGTLYTVLAGLVVYFWLRDRKRWRQALKSTPENSRH
jgi:hypothetical protein